MTQGSGPEVNTGLVNVLAGTTGGVIVPPADFFPHEKEMTISSRYSLLNWYDIKCSNCYNLLSKVFLLQGCILHDSALFMLFKNVIPGND
jgi:hypothetical protein